MAKKTTPNRKYTPEFKADVLRLIANGESILAVARKMGISDSIIHSWRAAQKKTKGGEKPASVLEEETVRRCGRIPTSATPTNGSGTRYFKKSCRHFQPHDLRLIYQFIKQEGLHFSVRLLCNTLEVSKSSYYEYRAGVTFQVSVTEQEMTGNVQDVFWENRRRYGSRRVQKALQEQGVEVGRHQVRRLMKRQNWQAIQPRSFVPRTTDSSHGLRACPNLLLELGVPVRPDQAWVSDITYLPLVGGGWAYLASWLDLYSRRIVGWCVDVTMEESLIIRAFDQATTLRRPQPGLIAHSDQGGQYFGKTFRARLDKWQCQQSMAEKENPYQNAHAESLWSRLKAELLEDGCFENLQDAHDELFNYIEGYYNIRRLHSSLGYLSPINFEKRYYQANFTHNSQS